ncbi:ATP synthase [Desulfurispora thermophila]|uniref:ATP synthase n=1 Tax=Desulfurispora thermophila TaxID=265470 RepID=UPI000524E65E|nr:ATP synthase [Desulfurispora thermophila]
MWEEGHNLGRIVEAYIGEYASGKSEVAVNRALELVSRGRRVTLVDLDIVEPCYTLRPLREKLAALGVDVVAWETRRAFGLGEAGNILLPQARWALKRPGDVILDVGYGVSGSRTLNLLEGVQEERDLQVIAVVNLSRPMTGTVPDIVEYIKQLGRVDALLNNTHLGDETTPEVVQQGARVVAQAAQELGLPVVATTAVEAVARAIGPHDCMGHPVRSLQRFMPATLW